MRKSIDTYIKAIAHDNEQEIVIPYKSSEHTL